MKQINQNAMVKVLEATAALVLTKQPNSSYNANNDMIACAQLIVEQYGIERKHLSQLTDLQAKFDKKLTTKYGINIVTGPMAFSQDLGAEMAANQVPQKIQVMTGLLDTVIGTVHMA